MVESTLWCIILFSCLPLTKTRVATCQAYFWLIPALDLLADYNKYIMYNVQTDTHDWLVYNEMDSLMFQMRESWAYSWTWRQMSRFNIVLLMA